MSYNSDYRRSSFVLLRFLNSLLYDPRSENPPVRLPLRPVKYPDPLNYPGPLTPGPCQSFYHRPEKKRGYPSVLENRDRNGNPRPGQRTLHPSHRCHHRDHHQHHEDLCRNHSLRPRPPVPFRHPGRRTPTRNPGTNHR